MVPVQPTIDRKIAQPILTELLGLLSKQCWWLLHQKDEDEFRIAKAFSCPNAKTNVLLTNAGIGKETAQNFTIVKK